MKDIVNIDKSIDFEVTRLFINSVNKDSPAEVEDLLTTLQLRIDYLTSKYPNAIRYITKICKNEPENSTLFYKLSGLLSLLDQANPS